MKVLILAGGFGSRLGELTKETPKPLLKIKDKPILEWIIINLKKHNLTDITISVGFLQEKIIEYFGSGNQLGVNINYEIESIPLGTGGAIKKFLENKSEDAIIINGDNLANYRWNEIINIHKSTHSKITITINPVENINQFGVVEILNSKIINFLEKPETSPSNLINSGAYIINPKVISVLPEEKSSIERNLFEKIVGNNIINYYIHYDQWFPTDTIERLENAEKNWNPNN